MTKNAKSAVKKPSGLAEIVELQLQRQRAEIIMGAVRDNLKSDTTIGEFRTLLGDDAIEMVVNEPVAELFQAKQKGRQARASKKNVEEQCDRIMVCLDQQAGLASPKHLSSLTGLPCGVVSTRLLKMAKDGRVEKFGDVYGMPRANTSSEDLEDCCETEEEAVS